MDLIKKFAKFLDNIFFSLKVKALKLLGFIDFSVPPKTSLKTTSSKTIRHYYESGINTYLPIAICTLYNQINLNSEELNILDFGCGAGRQILHFTKNYPKPNYYACDVNDSLFSFLQKHYPKVKFYCNNFEPPLKYDSNFFDIVYSVSIFSHLKPEDHPKWLQELVRITKKDGLIFLTTEGFTSLPKLKDSRNVDYQNLTKSNLEEAGIIYKEYKDFKKNKENEKLIKFGSPLIGITSSYGSTLMSPSYIKSNWVNYGLDVISILEGVIDHRQDLIILKKR